MKLIHLTNGGEAIIDDCDAHLNQYTWRKNPDGYPCRTIYFGRHDLNRVAFLHHFVMGKPINGKEVDHINGNRLDNRRSNLRIVHKRENGQNRAEHCGDKKTKSPFCGVHAENGKFYAMISIKNRLYRLGTYESALEAKEAYEDKAKELVVK